MCFAHAAVLTHSIEIPTPQIRAGARTACKPFKTTHEEQLQLVRDFTMEYGREPMRKDVLYDRELKKRFGPWTRMLEKAGTRPVSEYYLEGKKRRREKRERHKEYRRQLREQQAAEAARLTEAAGIECMYSRGTAAFWNKLKERSHSLLTDTAGSRRKRILIQQKKKSHFKVLRLP